MSTSAGIDIGSEAIKGVVLSRAAKGPVEILAAGTLPIGELGHMPDSTDKTLAVGLKLKSLVKTARIRANTRRTAVSGSATSIRYLQVPPVPPWRLDMLVKYEVDERNAEKEPSTYDYHILDVPEVAGQYTVMIGVCRDSTSNDMLSMGRASGLGEVEVDLEALALYNAYFHGHGFDHDKTVIVVDIGADDLTILICRNGSLWLARTIMGGGRRFTQVLADELKIEFPEADELKKTKAEISFDITTPSAPRAPRVPRPGGSVTGIISKAPGASGVQRATGESTLPGLPALSGSKLNISSTLLEPVKPADSSKPETLILKENFVTERRKAIEAQMRASKEAAAAPAPTPAAPTPAPAANDTASPLLADLSLSDMIDLPPALENIDSVPATAAPAATAVNMPVTPAMTQTSTPAVPAQSNDMNDERRKKQMSMALVREAASLCAALENAVLFCKQQSKLRDMKIDRVYVTGGGSKLKGLTEFMSRRMRLEVLPLEPFKQLSLDRLPVAQAEELKAEQHSMAIAVGLAVAPLSKGTFSFLLWPEKVVERKKFWARGAYLYYTAGLVALSFALFLYTPYRNADLLTQNKDLASKAVAQAKGESRALEKLKADNDEKRQRLKQIEDNTTSGQKFLDILAELKNTRRIGDDIYITSVSTSMPAIILRAGGAKVEPEQTPGDLKKAMEGNKNLEPDTFQYQRKVYLRGFARSNQKGDLIERVESFKSKLVPHPEDPEHPDNWLFKDIRTLWLMKDDQPQPPYFLKEFVLEAYTDSSKDAKTEKIKPPAIRVTQPPQAVPGPNQPAVPNPPAMPNPVPIEGPPKLQLPPAQQPQPQAGQPPIVQPPAPTPLPLPQAPEPPRKKTYTLPSAPPVAPAPAPGENK